MKFIKLSNFIPHLYPNRVYTLLQHVLAGRILVITQLDGDISRVFRLILKESLVAFQLSTPGLLDCVHGRVIVHRTAASECGHHNHHRQFITH